MAEADEPKVEESKGKDPSRPQARGSLPPPASIQPAPPRRAFGRALDRLCGGELGGTTALAALQGAGVALFAWGALVAIGEGTHLIFGNVDASAPGSHFPWWIRLLAPTLGGLACGLTIRLFAGRAPGLDVPELMDDVGRRGGHVDLRRGLAKTVASIFAIASGGSAGPEGPLVHAGGALASKGGRLLGIEGQRLKVMVACGAAAGLAAVFGAPIAGMIFAVEVVLGAVHMRALLPIATSAAFAVIVRHALFGIGLAEPVLQLPRYVGWLGPGEIAFALVIGAAGGLVGAAFSRSVSIFEDFFTALALPSWASPAVGGLVVGGMSFVMPQVLGHGFGSLGGVWPATAALTASLVAWKLLATSITIGSGAAGGIFMPAMMIGGALGAAFAQGAAALGLGPLQSLNDSYVLFGAAAVLAGTTHAALTAAVLVFEVTLEPGLIVPGLLAAGTSVVVASLLSKETIHTLSLKRHGGRARRSYGEASVLHETSVSALVMTDAAKVGRSEPLDNLVRKVLEGGAMYQHVVDENGKLLGTVSLQEVGPLLREDGVEGLLLAYDVMRAPPVSVTRSDTLTTCLERFARVDAGELPVVDGAGVLIGRVTRKDVLGFYAREVLEEKTTGMKFIARTDRTAAAVGQPEGDTPSSVVTDFVEVPPDHSVQAMPVPPGFVGRSLKDLNLRSRFGVGVISMRRRTPGGGRISLVAPDPNAALREGDVLVLAGPKDQMAKLLKLVGVNET
jgi:CIC family chloride channel protein